MIKRIRRCLILALFLMSKELARCNEQFALGELLEYNVHYTNLCVNVGTATMSIDTSTHTVNGRSCYKINVQGISNSDFSWLFKVNNTYGTYLDSYAFIPHRFYRNIQEKDFIVNEVVHFNHQQCMAIVEEWDRNNSKIVSKKKFDVPNNVHDLVSSYYSLRRLDTSQLKIGQKISLNIFFDGQMYQDATVIFLGKQKLTTKLGTFLTLVFSPVLPKGNLFTGENPVEIFISDDKNKIPLKLTMHLLIGRIEMDLKYYQGLGHPLNNRIEQHTS